MSNLKKGLVLEVSKNNVVVLTRDGRFLKQSYKGEPPELGSEIDIKEGSFNWKVWGMTGIAALLLVIIIPLFVLQLTAIPQEVVAYVTVDINPSLELGLNIQDRVVAANALNEDGKKILEKLDLKELPVDRALELITEVAIQEKYITQDKKNAVIISYSLNEPVHNERENNNEKSEEVVYSQEVQTLENAPSDSLISTKAPDKVPGEIQKKEQLLKKEMLQRKVMEVVQRNQQEAVVEIIHVSPRVRNQAKQLGLTPGKYTLMLEAWDEGVEISPENVKEKSIVSAIEEAGGDLGQIITHLRQKSSGFEEHLAEELSLRHREKIAEIIAVLAPQNGQELKLTPPTAGESPQINELDVSNSQKQGLILEETDDFLTDLEKEDIRSFSKEKVEGISQNDIEQLKKSFFDRLKNNKRNFIWKNNNELSVKDKIKEEFSDLKENEKLEKEEKKDSIKKNSKKEFINKQLKDKNKEKWKDSFLKDIDKLKDKKGKLKEKNVEKEKAKEQKESEQKEIVENDETNDSENLPEENEKREDEKINSKRKFKNSN